MGPRRSVHRAIFSRRCHQTPPWSVTGNRLTRDKVGAECTRRRFAHVRRLAHHGGRIVAPPGVSLPGPIAMARYRTTLAAYPAIRVRATISVRGRTRTGRIWFIRTAPFIFTERSVPATHANVEHRTSNIEHRIMYSACRELLSNGQF